LVTGAAGFVGRRLCSELSSRGWEVIGADVESAKPAPECAAWTACDVTSPQDVSRMFTGLPPVTHVFHLAAVTFVPEAEKRADSARKVNIEGTRLVAETLLDSNPSARLVYVSSADVYGPPQFLPVDETHPIQPRNVYAETKVEAEAVVRELNECHNLNAVTLRPFNHSGPGQSDRFVLSSFAHQTALAEAGLQPPVIRVGNLDAARDFSHVDDIVCAYELAAQKGLPGETYNLCSGRSVPIRHALEGLTGMAKMKVGVETDPARLRPVQAPEVRGSHEKFTSATGWRPEIPFGRLLHDLLSYWRLQVK